MTMLTTRYMMVTGMLRPGRYAGSGQHGSHQTFVNTDAGRQDRYQAGEIGHGVSQYDRADIDQPAESDVDHVNGRHLSDVGQHHIDERHLSAGASFL